MKTIVLDTDVGADSDDAVALGYLSAQVNKGRCKLPLITLSTSRKGAASFVRAVLSDYGVRSEIGRMEGFLECDRTDHYAEKSMEKYGFSDGAKDAVEGWKEVYLSEEKITPVVIGPQTNLAAFIRRHPVLFAQKTESVYVMGGNFSAEEAEYNVLCDLPAALFVAGNTRGVPFFYLPFEEGIKVLTGRSFIGRRERPVGYALKCTANAFGITDEADMLRQSWDPLTCLSALSPEFFYAEGGAVSYSAQGISAWERKGEKNSFLLRVKDAKLCEREIENALSER